MQSLSLLPYQEKAKQFILDNKKCALFLDMGLGKTAIVLSALKHIYSSVLDTSRTLIVGPKRVIEHTWPNELAKWTDFRHFNYSLIIGNIAQRLAAAEKDAHLYLISRDNLEWLTLKTSFNYDMLVIDELSSFKNPQSKRFKSIKFKSHRFKRVVGMTGTPAPNGLLDLWSQVFLLDQGERLGKTITQYRQHYFYAYSYGGFPTYEPKTTAQQQITDKLSDITISMTAKDYLDLPDMIYQEHKLPMEPLVSSQYNRLRKDLMLTIPENEPITAVNAAVLCGKLLQFCGGNIYTVTDNPANADRAVAPVHTMKLDYLDQLIEEANGQPVLVYYAYKHEFKAIKKKYSDAVDIKSEGAIDAWNRGQIRILLAHPASAGHGLNLQQGGHIIIWYNLIYDLELYQQANKRLHRMGQPHPVMVHHITIESAIDSQILNTTLQKKGKLQDAVIASLGL